MNKAADAIIAKFRACKSGAEIEAVATQHRAEVTAMETTDKERWHHVVNAKRIYLKRLRECPAST